MHSSIRRVPMISLIASLAILQGCEQQNTGPGADRGDSSASQSPLALQIAPQGIGSPDPTPTNISTLTQLNTTVRNNPTGNFRLTAHIDMAPAATWDNGKGWQPISSFKGTFDGNGYQIRNLTINRPQQWSVGLFGQVSKAIVRKVGLTNVNVKGNGWVGGLVGMLQESLADSCYVEGTVTAGTNQFGAGFNIGLFAGEISSSNVGRSYSHGTVNGDATSIGGFAGVVNHGTTGVRSVVHECYARADVAPNLTASDVKAGGFASRLVSSTALNLYAMGNSTNVVRGRSYVGGLFGELAGDGFIFDFCYSRNAITDWSVPSKAGTYGVLTGNPEHIASLFWDNIVDAGTSFAGTGQAGHSTTVLKTPISTAEFPYNNGTDADWDPAEWNPGTNTQYNVLRKVVRSTLQSPQ